MIDVCNLMIEPNTKHVCEALISLKIQSDFFSTAQKSHASVVPAISFLEGASRTLEVMNLWLKMLTTSTDVLAFIHHWCFQTDSVYVLSDNW